MQRKDSTKGSGANLTMWKGLRPVKFRESINRLLRVLKNKGFFGSLVEAILLERSPARLFQLYANLHQLLARRDLRFHFLREENLFRAKEGKSGMVRYFSNKKRGYWLYKNGITARVDFLAQTYCLRSVEFRPGDLVVDCGANYGDLFLAVHEKISPTDYWAIEPNPRDFSVLTRNNPSIRAMRIALGEKNQDMDLYVQDSRGDSSLIMPEGYTEIVKTPVRTLDSLIEDNGVSRIRLLKIEAEGYEPEVLRGSERALQLTDWVAVDGGPERGVERSATFPAVANFLSARGFELVDFYQPWWRALYRRADGQEADNSL